MADYIDKVNFYNEGSGLQKSIPIKDSDTASKVSSLATKVNTNTTSIKNLQTSVSAFEAELALCKKDFFEGTNVGCVGSGFEYATINAALSAGKTFIFVFPGTYNEQLVLNTGKTICITAALGLGSVTISGDFLYPNCVVNTKGNVSLKGLKFVNQSVGSYALHSDNGSSYPNDENILLCEDCYFESGGSSVGLGGSANSDFKFINCTFYTRSKDASIYLHNNPLKNIANQKMVFENCYIISTGGYSVRIDDAAASIGNTGSMLNLGFPGTTSEKSNSIQYVQNTASPGDVRYIPLNAPNIKVMPCSTGTNLLGVSYAEREYTFAYNCVKPSEGNIIFSVPFKDAENYDWTLTDVTIVGVAHITHDCTITSVTDNCITITSTNPAGAGYSTQITLVGTIKY